jgi:hypothetical protein
MRSFSSELAGAVYEVHYAFNCGAGRGIGVLCSQTDYGGRDTQAER